MLEHSPQDTPLKAFPGYTIHLRELPMEFPGLRPIHSFLLKWKSEINPSIVSLEGTTSN